MLCIECNENLVKIKKRKLCLYCYAKLRKEGFNSVKININTFPIFLDDCVIIKKSEYKNLLSYKEKVKRREGKEMPKDYFYKPSYNSDNKDMEIYFVQNEEGYIKIGRSINVSSRIRDLQVSSPTKLELLLTIPGDAKFEKVLHKALKKSRVLGEWFIRDENFTKGLKKFAIILKELM